MATNTIKITARFEDNTTRTYSLAGVPDQELNPANMEAKLNAYNDAWKWSLPSGAAMATLTGYEDYVGAMSSVLISTGGASIVSLVSATFVSEEEVTIYNG